VRGLVAQHQRRGPRLIRVGEAGPGGGVLIVGGEDPRPDDPAGAVRDGRRGAGGGLPPAAPGPRPPRPCRGVPAAGRLPVRRLPDGSWLSLLGGVPVRVIDAACTVITAPRSAHQRLSACRHPDRPDPFPASDLAVLHRERREVETACLELKSTVLGGRVLRARTPDGIGQEAYALLVTYQALRAAIADAASTAPGADPDRAGFTMALNTAGTSIDLVGQIGRLVLVSLMPPRRLRTSPAPSSEPSPGTAPGAQSTAPPARPPSTSPFSPPDFPPEDEP
jgi:hypothetical protein